MINEIIENININIIEAKLYEILNKIHHEGPIDPHDFEILSYIKKFHSNIFTQKENELLFLMGLFYKIGRPKNFIEEVYSIFSETIKEKTGYNFTPIQADAYTHITESSFFSFSAPTSVGKSYLFRELIKDTIGDIIIIVPSRALIAEYLDALKSFVDKDVLLLQFVDNVNIKHTKKRIFVLTPERANELFKYKQKFHIKLFLFDEAQISEEEIRGLEFDAFVRRTVEYFPQASKVFAHPYVNNPEAQLIKHNLTSANNSAEYNQNAVGKIFLVKDGSTFSFFSPYESSENIIATSFDPFKEIFINSGTLLIYISKDKIYTDTFFKEFFKYRKYFNKISNPKAIFFIEQLRDYIGASKREDKKKISRMIKYMEYGIVTHHGSMPLKMRAIIEKFVRGNFAKICFATSTLVQGINMPFDAVYIDNYYKVPTLILKNLIGRAGRATVKNSFDYGYTIINITNKKSFCKRINEKYELKTYSLIEENINMINEDSQDLVEAIQNNTFDDETRLTEKQIERIKNSSTNDDIKLVLDNFFFSDNEIRTGNSYYSLPEKVRNKIKIAFQNIYSAHLRRRELTEAEKSILSAAIPILLWQIQGKTFKEMLALRYSYLTKQDKQHEYRNKYKNGEITENEMNNAISNLEIKYTPIPFSLPNKKGHKAWLFYKKNISEFDYDSLVFDTYDYIDKVINYSLSDPICAAFTIFYNDTNDVRAKILCNYIRYATNDEVEIWLLRYGFTFEDILWLKQYILKIDENEIIFAPSIKYLDQERKNVIERYLFDS